jgi:hypothetical protein
MPDIEGKYELFQLNNELREHLRQLSDSHFPFSTSRNRIVVETVVVENGERTIVRKEEQDAKLV